MRAKIKKPGVVYILRSEDGLYSYGCTKNMDPKWVMSMANSTNFKIIFLMHTDDMYKKRTAIKWFMVDIFMHPPKSIKNNFNAFDVYLVSRVIKMVGGGIK